MSEFWADPDPDKTTVNLIEYFMSTLNKLAYPKQFTEKEMVSKTLTFFS